MEKTEISTISSFSWDPGTYSKVLTIVIDADTRAKDK